jgi:hypothetical protein
LQATEQRSTIIVGVQGRGMEESMVEINVLFSTNYCDRTDLEIEKDAIPEFTREAYADGTYSAVVQFECLPRAFNPDVMQIIIDLKDIGECIVAWGTICGAIISFVKKVHGYVKHIMIEGTKQTGEIIEITDETTPDELEKKIKDVIEK